VKRLSNGATKVRRQNGVWLKESPEIRSIKRKTSIGHEGPTGDFVKMASTDPS
jgi:hypothetical protein